MDGLLKSLQDLLTPDFNLAIQTKGQTGNQFILVTPILCDIDLNYLPRLFGIIEEDAQSGLDLPDG